MDTELPSQSPKVRVGFIGSGQRMQTVYLPLLRQLDGYEIVGFTSRTPSKGEERAKELNLPYFASTDALIASARPELCIVCVPPRSTYPVIKHALRYQVALLIETPVAPTVPQARALAREIEKRHVLVGVAEQKPFLPLEQLKHILIKAGVIGRPVMVENDFRSYDYHAFAQLRSYIDPASHPLSLYALSSIAKLPSYFASYQWQPEPASEPTREKWDLALASFSDGTLLAHHFSSVYKTTPFRPYQSLRVYGDRGAIINDRLTCVTPTEQVVEAVFRESKKNDPAGTTVRVTCELPDGRSFEWKNPYSDYTLTDDQIALALHLNALCQAMRGQGRVLYSVEDAIQDIELVTAMSFSSKRGGAKITFPFNPYAQYLRLFLSPAFWKYMLARRKIVKK